jgi:heme a synthase
VTTRETKVPSSGALLRWIRFLSLLTVAATYCLTVTGSTVRVTNSGMGCKGWPLCSGQVGPISQFHPLMEQTHRYLVSLVTVLIVVLALVVLRSGNEARHVRGPALASVGVIVVQIVLGAVTVITNNTPITVALHLLIAMLFLAIVTVMAVGSFIGADRTWSLLNQPGRLAWTAICALFLVLISGSVVVDGGAQSACASWPLCPSSTAAAGLVAIQLAHRSMVLVSSVLVVAFLFTLLRAQEADFAERKLAIGALVLLAIQVVVGALSALNSARAGIADVHLAFASALWCVVVAVFALAARSAAVPSPRPVPRPKVVT